MCSAIYIFKESMSMKTFIMLLLFIVFQTHAEWVPKILWTYWEEDIAESDHAYKILAYNHQNMISKDWQYRFLNKQNCWQWLSQIPNATEVLQRPQFQGKGQYALRSKFIRLALLKHFGGVWMDYTIILTSNLDWLFKLKQDSNVDNKYQDVPEVFLPYNIEHQVQEKKQGKQMKKVIVLPGYDIFFIAAKPNSKLITEWLELFIFLNEKQENFQSIQKQGLWLSNYGSNIYYKAEIALLALLQRKQKQFQKEWTKNDKKQEKKLVPRQYKIWTVKTLKMGYKLHNPSVVDVIIQKDIDELKARQGFPDYFIKFHHYLRGTYFNQLANTINSLLNQGSSSDCSIEYIINMNSMFYQYMFQFYRPSLVSLKSEMLKPYSLQCSLRAYQRQNSLQIDYSEKKQSLMLMKLFQNISDGSYVDILNSGYSLFSNTMGLLTKGWKGISVGIDNKYSSLLKQGDTYLNYLVTKKVNFEDMGQITLSDLCEKYYSKKPTFMNLGTESVQQNVLEANNWSNHKCRPQVILVNSENIKVGKAISNLKINKYRLLSNLTFEGVSTGLIFVEYPLYKKYRQVIDEEKGYIRKASIQFLQIKKAIDIIFPEQSISMMFVSKQTSIINIETIKNTLSKKVIFIFGSLKKVIVSPGKSNIEKKIVRISVFQFSSVTATFQNDSIQIYIFNNNKGIQVIIDQYLFTFSSENDQQLNYSWDTRGQLQLLDSALASYEQNANLYKQKQVILKIIITVLIGIVVVASYFFLSQFSTNVNVKKNIYENLAQSR